MLGMHRQQLVSLTLYLGDDEELGRDAEGFLLLVYVLSQPLLGICY